MKTYMYDREQKKVVEITGIDISRSDKCRHNIIEDIPSFDTEHITGDRIRVRSRRHKNILLKQYGLVEYCPNRSSKNRRRSHEANAGRTGSEGFSWDKQRGKG